MPSSVPPSLFLPIDPGFWGPLYPQTHEGIKKYSSYRKEGRVERESERKRKRTERELIST